MHGLSSCGSWALEHGLSSCGEWVWLLCGTQNLPGPAIKPMSPALTGGFLSSATMEVLICVYFSLEDNGLQDCVDFCHVATWISPQFSRSVMSDSLWPWHYWVIPRRNIRKLEPELFSPIFFLCKWIGFFYCLEAYSIYSFFFLKCDNLAKFFVVCLFSRHNLPFKSKDLSLSLFY